MFIAIEAPDSVGKGTQAKLLHDALEEYGYRVKLLSFPRYTETISGKYLGRFLRGEFGSLADVHPVLAAALFAADRFESQHAIKRQVELCDFVIADRYTVSNFAHQAAKLPDDQIYEFKEWISYIEGNVPKPDLYIYLKADMTVMRRHLKSKAEEKRSYTDKLDIHEADTEYLQRVLAVYDKWAENAPYQVATVDVRDTADGPRSREQIHQRIMQLIGEGAVDVWGGRQD